MIHKIRKTIGRWKMQLIDTLPYLARHKKIPIYRKNLSKFVHSLPPVIGQKSKPDIEVHMLCGKRDIDMGVTASWSMLRFAGEESYLYVHSDGSLDSQDELYWKKIIPNTIFIQREQSDLKVAETLEKEAPQLYKWRCQNWASAQLVDMHLFGKSPSILIMDSDVIVLQEPTEVFDTISITPPIFAWCRDHLNAYSASIGTIKQITGKELPMALCAGFLVSPRQSINNLVGLDREIDKIDKDHRVETNHFWSCQTYYGLLTHNAPGSKEFTSEYNNRNGKTKNEPLRHYVGVPKIRFRYFTEGVAQIAEQIGVRYEP